VRKYVGDAMSFSGMLYQTKQTTTLDDCLDGVWCAFRNISGPFVERAKMPKVLKEFWTLFLKFHPFFWSHLIQGNYRRILRDIRVHFQIK
jgi:hypothetical protein